MFTMNSSFYNLLLHGALQGVFFGRECAYHNRMGILGGLKVIYLIVNIIIGILFNPAFSLVNVNFILLVVSLL